MSKPDWFFVGFVKEDEYSRASEIAESYKCKVKGDFYSDKALFVNNSFRVSSIRNKLWGHRWATSGTWIAENPGMENFDPAAKVKRTPRKTRGTVKQDETETKG